ncbi:glycine-rich domain-containing protein [Aquiflexum sp.]|uniref:glycine-rich domain-containing protein n=1 Tax=Aquiflexum sp. TaxID=1872584 RepID=UPI003593F279
MKTKLSFCFLISFTALFFDLKELYAQCTPCTVNIVGNAAPDAAISNGSTVCITGNRTSQIVFNNSTNISICIGNGASWNGSFSQLSSLSSIDNFGELQISNDFNGNWTINNYRFLTFSGNINSNKSIYNYGDMIVPGGLNVSSNATFNSNGNLSIGGAVNLNSNANVSLEGNTAIGGSMSINSNVSVNFSGYLSIGGALQLNSNSGIYNLNANRCNSISVAGAFNNNGIISGNNFNNSGSPLLLNKAPSGNALSGGAAVGNCPFQDCLQTEIIETPSGYDAVFIYRCSDVFTMPSVGGDEEIVDVMVAVVAGGGGAGRGEAAGGGGAGAISKRDGLPLNVGAAYPVAVGSGGTGSNAVNQRGSNGTISSFFGINSFGGGGGGSSSAAARNGLTGGSGGGAAANNNPGNGQGTRGGNAGNQTNSGGNGRRGGNGNQLNGGGGGGAGGPGNDGANNNPGNGGNGVGLNILSNIPNIQNSFGGGGGSTGRNPSQTYGTGTGGSFSGIPLGGDGNASPTGGAGGSGRANTGSGGGAGSINGGAGSAGIVIIRISYRILPVQYLYFDADFIVEKNAVDLKWSTGEEWENSHFEIERSMDHMNDWETLGETESVGWSDVAIAYSFQDTALPLLGGIAYYRLKQVGLSGMSHLSKVVSVRIPSQQLTNDIWRVFPNPNSGGRFTLDLLNSSEYAGEDLRVRLISPLSGNYVVEGNDLRKISEQIREQLGKSPNGVYILEVSWGKKVEHLKLMRKSYSDF